MYLSFQFIFLDTQNRRVIDFSGTHFGDRSIFNGSKFYSLVRFASTSLHKVEFSKEPPEFFDANFLGSVEFPTTELPIPSVSWQAKRARHAYERLKSLMDDQKKIYEEYTFYRMEMRCREIEVGLLNSLPSRAYGLFSGYGWSLRRPACSILLTFAFGWASILVVESRLQNPSINTWTAAALSLSNIFGFFGFSSTFLSDELAGLSAKSQFISAVQTVLGVLFFFFIAMGFRNRFRMR